MSTSSTSAFALLFEDARFASKVVRFGPTQDDVDLADVRAASMMFQLVLADDLSAHAERSQGNRRDTQNRARVVLVGASSSFSVVFIFPKNSP